MRRLLHNERSGRSRQLRVLLCCLPVVTVGAAVCSMHAVLLKIYRGEEQRIIADFFQAMKSNLKNGTILWLLYLAYLGLLVSMWYMAACTVPDQLQTMVCGLLIAGVLGLLYLDWACILQSRYVYTIPQCLKFAVLAWLKYPGSTLVYPVSLAAPLLLCQSWQMLPLVALVGVTLPHFISTTLYSRIFDRMEGVPPRVHKL